MHNNLFWRVIGITIAILCLAGAEALAAESRRVTIQSDTGREIEATLYLPEDLKGSAPGVLVLHTYYGMVHGYAENFDHKYGKALADQGGYVALVPNYAKFGRKGYLPGITDDLKSVFKWLKKRPETVGKSIAVIGFSAGGYHAIRLAGIDPEIKAAIGYYGVYDISKLPFAKKIKIKIPPSSASFAQDINAAVLLFHGDKDNEIPLNQSEALASALKAAGKANKLVVFKNAYHRFDRGPNDKMSGDVTKSGHIYRLDRKARDDAFQETLRWLETYLR
jgi:dienelactone hydrolase